jgi:carbamate kinase
MNIRKITDDDIPEISRWFKSIQWDLPPVDGVLPKDGFVAEKDGVLVACAWIYLTGSSVAFVQWSNTNPDLDAEVQSAGIAAVMKQYQDMSQHLSPPIKTIVTYTKNERFKAKLKSLDFRSQFGFYQCTWVGKRDADKKA